MQAKASTASPRPTFATVTSLKAGWSVPTKPRATKLARTTATRVPIDPAAEPATGHPRGTDFIEPDPVEFPALYRLHLFICQGTQPGVVVLCVGLRRKEPADESIESGLECPMEVRLQCEPGGRDAIDRHSTLIPWLGRSFFDACRACSDRLHER